MEMNCKEKLRDERSYWKVAVSLGFSLVGTCLFLYFGYKLLGFFMPFVIGWCQNRGSECRKRIDAMLNLLDERN